jgi:hypothetical protein
MLNNLRILSKISLSEECCKIMMENKEFLKNIISFFKTYKSNTYIIIRVGFILAYFIFIRNISSYFSYIRDYIYFQLEAFDEIFGCFLFYFEMVFI